MKRLLSAVLCLFLLVVSLSACGTGSGTKDDKSPSGTQKTMDAAAEDKTPITFRLWWGDAGQSQLDDQFQSPVAQKIKEATGVTLKIEFSVGDINQKISLMTASADYPDMISPGPGGTVVYNMLHDAKAMVPLDDMIEQYGPNIKKLFGDYYKRLRFSLQDPHIYAVGASKLNEKFEPNTGFQIQCAVLKELGYPKMKTLSDLENAVKTYIGKVPTIDGQPAIGFSLLADDWRFLISVSNPGFVATGAPDDGEWYFDQKTNKAILHLMRPEEKEYFRWVNHMNDIGLLDKESFIQKYDQYQAKIASGRMLSLADAKWEYVQAESALIQGGKEDRIYANLPLQLTENTKCADFMAESMSGPSGFCVTTKCKDPVRAVKFMNWMASEEAQILMNWGIEGKDYTLVDGKRVISPENWKRRNEDPNFSKETGINFYYMDFPHYGRGEKDSTGQYFQPIDDESILKNYTKSRKEMLAAYGVKMERELYPPASDFGTKAYGSGTTFSFAPESEGNVIFTKYTDITRKRIPEAILCKPSEFDAKWDQYVAELKEAGIDKMTEEFNSIVQDTLKLWNQ